MERNLLIYRLYSLFYQCYSWQSVFFLFFMQQVGIEGALQLEAIYYGAVVLLEVPSGYFSDRIGRKATLLIGSVALALSYTCFFVSDGFAHLALAQFLLATGYAFASGTDTALLYDSLRSIGRTHEYEARENKIIQQNGYFSAATVLFGGLIAGSDLRWAYLLACVCALVALGACIFLKEPPVAKHEKVESFKKNLATCWGFRRDRTLRFFFLFSVLAIVSAHMPYEYFQPYLEATMGNLDKENIPLVSAIVTAATGFTSSTLARFGPRIARRCGVPALLFASQGALTLLLLSMALWIHPLIVVLTLGRSSPNALARATVLATISPLVPRQVRATYLSLQSLVGRLSFSGILLLMGSLVPPATKGHGSIQAPIFCGVAILAVGLLFLAGQIPQHLKRQTKHL